MSEETITEKLVRLGATLSEHEWHRADLISLHQCLLKALEITTRLLHETMPEAKDL